MIQFLIFGGILKILKVTCYDITSDIAPINTATYILNNYIQQAYVATSTSMQNKFVTIQINASIQAKTKSQPLQQAIYAKRSLHLS